MTKKNKTILLAAVVIFVAALAAGFWASRMLDLETHRAALIERLKIELNRDVRYAKGEFSLWLRPAFTFTDVVILEKDAQTTFITADRLSFKLRLLPLFRKKIVLQDATLENPRIALIREADGAFNVSDLFDDRQQELSFEISRLQIQNGALHFTDRRIAPEPPTTSLEGINLRLNRLERGKTADFSLNAMAVDIEKSGAIVLDGSIDIAPASEPLLNSRIDTAVKASGLNAGSYWPHYSRHVPFKKITGRLDIDARYRGNIREFESKGSFTLHDLHFDYPPVFHAPLKPKTVHAVYEMRLDPHDIAVTHLDVTVDGVQIKGSCLLKDIQSDDPLIDSKAVTTEIRWEAFSHYVPYGIIPKDVADFIEQKIKGGIFRLDEGRLHGRVSQIAHMEKGDNFNALHVRGRAQNSVLEYAPDVPVFTHIAGNLELKGKDFILQEMTGKFGDAPFSLDGKLADYCLDTPTRYPFTLKMAPTAKEVSWLLGGEPAKKLSFTGNSTLRLSGDGSLTNYNLSGAWDLTAADYKYSEWLEKPAGKASHLSFKVNRKEQETLFSSFQYNLSPLSLTGKIRLRGDTLETSQMALKLGSSVISAQGTIANLKDPSFAVTFGSERVDVTDLGLHHPEQAVSLENVSGFVVFKDRDLQIDALTFRLNESILNITGAVQNVQDHPKTRISVASPYLDSRDVLILSDLRRVGKTGQPPVKMSLDAAVRVDAGRMNRLAFEKMQMNLSLDENILYLKEIAFNALGGRLAGGGRIDLADAKAPRYQFNFDLDKLSAEQCLPFFDVKEKFITGAFSAKGDLTAKGDNGVDLKKTALGNVRIQIEEGMLTRFAVLSKIFSILNISQLLKFQLPDMVSGGMPYDKITATLSVKDGIVSTQDLFIRSDAMNISAVATIDMPGGAFVDTVVGVQPLQTVDKVVSLIPVVGWILTDENRSILTVYFEVKGSLDSPTVTAIPVKAMARGVFDIFKNIFQLPAKLFTDTGEVIFGR